MGSLVRRFPFRRKFNYRQEYSFETYAMLDGEEVEPVEVFYEASEEEPDVNWPGGLDINRVIYQGESITDRVEDWEELQARAEADCAELVRAYYEGPEE
jgi:hypothetical protein